MTSQFTTLRMDIQSNVLTESELVDLVRKAIKIALCDKLTEKAFENLIIHRGKYTENRRIRFVCEYYSYTASDMNVNSKTVQQEVREIIKTCSNKKRKKLPYLNL